MDYASSLHFATIGGDNGHDGQTGRPFLNNPEVINDFAYRSVHVTAVIGSGFYNFLIRALIFVLYRQANSRTILFPFA
jgi:hypothetical protein